MIHKFENYGSLNGYGEPLVNHPLNPKAPVEDPHWETSFDMTFKPDSRIAKKKPNILLINSLNRNTDLDDANGSQKYSIDLTDHLREVVKVRLEIVDIPKSRYLIHSYNDTFRFQETNAQVSAGTYHEITITHGDYDAADLCQELQDAMDVVSVTSYDVSYSATTRKVTITQEAGGADVFNIIFTDGPKTVGVKKYPYFSNSIGKVLGFKPVNHTGASQSTYIGDWVVDLSYGDYIVLKINDFDNLQTPVESGIKNVWCPIYLDEMQDKYRLINYGWFDSYNLQFKNLKRTGKLTIELFDKYGNPYETNGADHSILFSIISMGNTTLEDTR